jgi:hypothetical protein
MIVAAKENEDCLRRHSLLPAAFLFDHPRSSIKSTA